MDTLVNMGIASMMSQYAEVIMIVKKVSNVFQVNVLINVPESFAQ